MDDKDREGIKVKHLWKDLIRTFKYSQSGNCTRENGIWKKEKKAVLIIRIISVLVLFFFPEGQVSSLTSNLLHLSSLPPFAVSPLVWLLPCSSSQLMINEWDKPWTDGQTDRPTDGWTDGKTNRGMEGGLSSDVWRVSVAAGNTKSARAGSYSGRKSMALPRQRWQMTHSQTTHRQAHTPTHTAPCGHVHRDWHALYKQTHTENYTKTLIHRHMFTFFTLRHTHMYPVISLCRSGRSGQDRKEEREQKQNQREK